MSGPEIVVKNTLAALEQEKVPFAVNEDKYSYNFIMQYNALGHKKHEHLEHESCFIGPQFWGWDEYGRFLFENPQYYNKLIVPSEWVRYQLFSPPFNVPKDKLAVWPVGIDIPDFEKSSYVEWDCLIYFKRRDKKELNQVTQFLDSKKMSYNILGYGNYSQEELLDACKKSSFCFLLNGTESQGIAVQEIMATNTPLLVWEVKEWNDMGEEYRTPATTIPYWNACCGEIFDNIADLPNTFSKFYDRIEEFTPRLFVENELSYKKSLEILFSIMNA